MEALEVPLKREIFDLYELGKTHELRAPYGIYAPENIFPGRPVVLHRGRGGRARSGVIGEEIVLGSLDEILLQVPYNHIAPRIESRERFIEKVHGLLLGLDKYIAFEVNLDQ